ncbi:Otoferlin, partial [Eumeta japonica]
VTTRKHNKRIYITEASQVSETLVENDFHFFYQHAERKVVLKSAGMFSNQEEHVPPVLVVQVMDSDAITADDFLGSLSLNLNSMPRGAKMARQADVSLLKRVKKVNLFSINSIRGWWPLKILDHKTGTDMPAGVIDLEMTLLPKEKAVYMPVGLGREGPHPLPLPKRPETSFNVYMNPLLTLKTFMRNRGYKSLFITASVAMFLILLLSAVTNVPRILLEK